MISQRPKEQRRVIISSTVLDLPEYRQKAKDACLRMGLLPLMMEHLPALDEDPIAASMKIVDDADIYVGIFAHRYGYVPSGCDTSITEMEYERAVKRGIPRLLFLMHEDVRRQDIDGPRKVKKLKRLKERMKRERVVGFFMNPEDLWGKLIHSLHEEMKQWEAEHLDAVGKPSPETLAEDLRYIAPIPTTPEPYVAHPYVLLQLRGLTGRRDKLKLLCDWLTRQAHAETRILSIVAMGGMGKSALAWHWFTEVVPQVKGDLAGRMWWSFYERDATFENFVTRALAYVSRRPVEQIENEPLSKQQEHLLAILDQDPFLLVLDGLERLLFVYASQEPIRLSGDEVLDEAADPFAWLSNPSESVGERRLLKTVDWRVGQFLRRLAQVRATRVLISTRLYPVALQEPTGAPMPGCLCLDLEGLNDQEALELWGVCGAYGSRKAVRSVLHSFESHPLLIRLLASEVARFPDAPGDFDAWQTAHPDFNPFGMPLVQVRSHVLLHALRGLTPAEHRTLYLIAAFRMPAGIATIKSLLIPADAGDDPAEKPFFDGRDLYASLTRLEDRGLLAWDRRLNRFDMHPIVRGVVWKSLNTAGRARVYRPLFSHFKAIPKVEDPSDVESIEDVIPIIELYNTLIGLARYKNALNVLRVCLQKATLHRLSASGLWVELVKRLFPDGWDAPPRLEQARDQSYAFRSLALGYHLNGQLVLATRLYERAAAVDEHEGDQQSLCVTQHHLSEVLFLSGSLRSAEISARKAVILSRMLNDRFQESVSLNSLGLAMTARGEIGAGEAALRRALRISEMESDRQSESLVRASLSEQAIWRLDTTAARLLADQAWELAVSEELVRDSIRAARLQGTAALFSGQFDTAHERLRHALSRARALALTEEELPALIALSELHLLCDERTQARTLLDDVLGPAEEGPYSFFYAGAFNVLAHIERDAGNMGRARDAATAAYRNAWCDGPPFAYHWVLEKARERLAALGSPEPILPPFDASRHELMPELEIDPDDQFRRGRPGEAQPA